MGREYTASLAIGFYVSEGELEAPFKAQMPERSRSEIRYNELDGRPYIKNVVDECAGERLVFMGEDMDSSVGLAEAIAAELTKRCGFEVDLSRGGDMYEGQHEFVFGLKHEFTSTGALDPVRLVSTVLSSMSHIDILKGKMTELGLRPDFYLVHCLEFIG